MSLSKSCHDEQSPFFSLIGMRSQYFISYLVFVVVRLDSDHLDNYLALLAYLAHSEVPARAAVLYPVVVVVVVGHLETRR